MGCSAITSNEAPCTIEDKTCSRLSECRSAGDWFGGENGNEDVHGVNHIFQEGKVCRRNVSEQCRTEQHYCRIETESNTTLLSKKDSLPNKTCSTSIASGEAASFRSASPAIQKLNLFKFVKTDRKRTREGRERDEVAMDGGLLLKRPTMRDTDDFAQTRPMGSVCGTLENEAERCDGGTERTSDGGMQCRSNASSRLESVSLLTSTVASNRADILPTATSLIEANNVPAARGSTTPFSSISTALNLRPHTPLHANRKSSDSVRIQPHSIPEFLTPSQARLSVGLTTPTSRMTAPIGSTPNVSSATNSKFLTPQRSSTRSSRLSSRLTNPLPTFSNASSPSSASPSMYSTPKGKRLPSSTAAALICTPTNEPGSVGIGIIGTPVPLPRRRFPGPAGLLPPLVGLINTYLYVMTCCVNGLLSVRLVHSCCDAYRLDTSIVTIKSRRVAPLMLE